MKIIRFLLLFTCFAALSCGEPIFVNDNQYNYYDYFSEKCYYKYPSSFEERMKKPPFDKMKRLEIVTFQANSVNYGEILEKVLLTQKDIDTVSQVLNYTKEKTQIRKLPLGATEDNFGIATADCCIPRHALLFYNEKDEMYLKWRICFECNCNRPVYIDHNNQYETLRLLFKRIGIKQFINPE